MLLIDLIDRLEELVDGRDQKVVLVIKSNDGVMVSDVGRVMSKAWAGNTVEISNA